ncbi:MAG TPA: ATP-binding cassette domain-containing protein [Kofleriaceae bacterium]|nr:ATP-binding cassette domain-containing protein [Kofleriaceae bacterium]
MLLQVDKLTLRFRGITAVNKVDLVVNEGEIVAVIGPNGAGKTSLFNAITGIYEPTDGVVRLAGQDLRTAPRRSNLVRWGLAGLVIGLLLFLWVADVNQMWAAVVRANYRSAKEGFQVGSAVSDLGAFLAGRPRIDARTGRFYVTSTDGSAPFGSSKTREEAEAKRAAIPTMAALPADGSTIREEASGKFSILADDMSTVLDVAPTREVALERLAAARVIDETAAAAVRRRLIAGFLGFCIGVAGAWAVWRQTRRTPASVAARGIARTFQNIRLFQDMTVVENVLVGMDRHLSNPHRLLSRRRLLDAGPVVALAAAHLLLLIALRAGLLPGAAAGALLTAELAGAVALLVVITRRGTFSRTAGEVEATGRAQALELLGFVGLAERADDLSKNLPYGAQRRLEIARALATRPKLLLLDEPAAGMNPAETVELMALIQKIRERKVTVLLIEHHMRVVMGISDRIAVLVYGEKIAEGTPDEIRADAKVVEAYLGQEQLG